MSYLERLKKLNMPPIGSVVSVERPLDTLDTSDKSLISVKNDALDTLDTSKHSRIPENQFLPDSQVKRNQSRCSDCINLYPCPEARNITGRCSGKYSFTLNPHARKQ